jgi:hypothetical protein
MESQMFLFRLTGRDGRSGRSSEDVVTKVHPDNRANSVAVTRFSRFNQDDLKIAPGDYEVHVDCKDVERFIEILCEAREPKAIAFQKARKFVSIMADEDLRATGKGLSGPERVLLFCLASGTDWQNVGVIPTTVQRLTDLCLIESAGDAGNYALTDEGRGVLTTLLAEQALSGWLENDTEADRIPDDAYCAICASPSTGRRGVKTKAGRFLCADCSRFAPELYWEFLNAD